MLNSNTSLHLAVQNGNIDIVKMLLEAGHSPNEVNADGLSPLGLAVQMGHTDIVTLLAERTEKNDHPIIAPASTTPVDTSHNVGNAVNLLRKEKSMKRQYFADSETGRIYGNAPPIPSTEPESPPIKITWGNFLRMNIFTGKIMSDDQLKEQEIIEQQKWESRGWAYRIFYYGGTAFFLFYATTTMLGNSVTERHAMYSSLFKFLISPFTR